MNLQLNKNKASEYKCSLTKHFNIKNIICSFLYDLKDVINLYNLNKDHQNNIKIINLYDIPEKYLKRLDQQIIEQHKFRFVEKLNLCNNENIKNVNHMKTLKILDCCGRNNVVNQNGISELNLIAINIFDNKNIKINYMKYTLKVLEFFSFEADQFDFFLRANKLDQNGIININLIKLFEYCENKKIKNVNRMKNTRVARNEQKLCLLKTLESADYNGIDYKSVLGLNLIKLDVNGNKKIQNINHMKETLKILNYNC